MRENRAVSRDFGLLTAEKYNLASFLEVSSKTEENVAKAFEIMIEKLIERYPESTMNVSSTAHKK